MSCARTVTGPTSGSSLESSYASGPDKPKEARWSRVDCAGCALVGPIFLAVATPFDVGKRVLRVVTGYHFWDNATHRPYNFKARLLETGKEILRAIFIPLCYAGQEVIFLYGIIDPELAQEADKKLLACNPF